MSTTTTRTTRNQEPEPVRPWFARLFRCRPTVAEPARASLTAVAVDPADAMVAAFRRVDERRLAADDLQRWKSYADSLAREAEDRTKERDGAYRERAQLLAWITALHPSSSVIAPSPDVDEDGWQLLYLVAGGWQMSWHIHPRDADLFRHVTVVDVTDPRAQWDGHGTVEKYERIHNLVRLLALDDLSRPDGSLTAVMTGPEAQR
ncbi:hypothetical protein GCM10010372_30900 [Streptomyces tauricus]|uniref:hypothetical protein n=1 Tax=Streptomyces tauricus TaxID=68274 RepID=UPI001671D215|nr:hypothetical protein [Streptomyces tauricus]GHA28851.1 hypothetical protein GCM10010372_30900 [Streptomyces tauricus]